MFGLFYQNRLLEKKDRQLDGYKKSSICVEILFGQYCSKNVTKRYFETENDYKTDAIVVYLQLKRRSGRNVKRKKYMDDVDLNLSDDNTMDLLPTDTEGAVVKPVQLGWRPCCLGTFTNMSLYLNCFGFHMMTSRFALV